MGVKPVESNFEAAKTWVLKDEHVTSLPGLGHLWDGLRLDQVPSGLDYYLLDCAVCFTAVTTGQWLDLVTATKSPSGQLRVIEDMGLEVVISGLELFRRRRIKADPEWQRYGSEWSNRCNRVRKRALALAEPQVAEHQRLLVETA